MKSVYIEADARFEQLIAKTCDLAFKFGMPIFFCLLLSGSGSADWRIISFGNLSHVRALCI